MDTKYDQQDENEETDENEEDDEFSVKSTDKMLKSSRTLIQKISRNKSTNPVSDTIALVVNICKVVAVFEPTIGLTTGVLLLFKDLTDTWHGQFKEKTSADQHFLTLMGIALTNDDLSTARSGLEDLMEQINAQIDDLITKQKITEKTKESFASDQQEKTQTNTNKGLFNKDNNWFKNNISEMKNKLTDNQFIQNVLNISQLKKDKENWLRSCQLIYDTYKVASVPIRANLQKCVDTINSSSNTLKLETAKIIIDQVYEFIHLIYFRYVVYMVMANIFGNGASVEDKPNNFENKNTIIHKLNASNVKLLSKLQFLWRPKLQNRIIITLFYRNKASMMAINCLQRFHKTIVFANPEQDLCPFWNHQNVMSPFFRLYCKKWPEERFCIGVDKKFALESKHKNNNLTLRRVNDLSDVNAFGIYRIHLFYVDSTGTKILNLYYHKQCPLATDYMTLTSINDDQWKFIIVKIFDDGGDFYYISPYTDTGRYIYMRAGISGEIASYNGVENKPTEQAMWLQKPGTQTLDKCVV
eukprot:248847_1